MSLVVNTNVSSLTAQRALAYADSLQGEAMTRLSTGSKINSASDDAAGLAIAQRMTSQVNGLNMAIKKWYWMEHTLPSRCKLARKAVKQLTSLWSPPQLTPWVPMSS